MLRLLVPILFKNPVVFGWLLKKTITAREPIMGKQY